MKVSVALRPTPTTSSLGECVINCPGHFNRKVKNFHADRRKGVQASKEPLTAKSRSLAPLGMTIAERRNQLKRVVRQSDRPQIIRRKKRAPVRSAAGPQCRDIWGTRAMAA